MAKTKMKCPFSDKACKECAIYRGRHYYWCFNPKYRGHLNKSDLSSVRGNAPISTPDIIERFFTGTVGI